MASTTNYDDALDAIAHMLAYLNKDTEATKVIHDNCDLGPVLTNTTVIAVKALTRVFGGEDGARKALARFQRRIAGRA